MSWRTFAGCSVTLAACPHPGRADRRDRWRARSSRAQRAWFGGRCGLEPRGRWRPTLRRTARRADDATDRHRCRLPIGPPGVRAVATDARDRLPRGKCRRSWAGLWDLPDAATSRLVCLLVDELIDDVVSVEVAVRWGQVQLARGGRSTSFRASDRRREEAGNERDEIVVVWESHGWIVRVHTDVLGSSSLQCVRE